jgi:hypothetical protein
VARGDSFEFSVVLFGRGCLQLPFWIIPWDGAGDMGVGYGRGRFALTAIENHNPLTGAREVVLPAGSNVVTPPEGVVSHADVLRAHAQTPPQPQLRLDFATPLRIIHDKHTLRTPDFDVIFHTLLYRLDVLTRQYCDPDWRRPEHTVARLNAAASRVRLRETHTEWVETFSGSNRSGRSTPTGGLLGWAGYDIGPDDWHALRPWLLWGELTQVGKNTVKGDGVIRISP